jgi:hypothetical protein
MESETITVIVRNLPPENIRIELTKSSTVKFLRAEILKTNPKLKDTPDFSLIFRGRILKNELSKVSDYGISDNSAVFFAKSMLKRNRQNKISRIQQSLNQLSSRIGFPLPVSSRDRSTVPLPPGMNLAPTSDHDMVRANLVDMNNQMSQIQSFLQQLSRHERLVAPNNPSNPNNNNNNNNIVDENEDPPRIQNIIDEEGPPPPFFSPFIPPHMNEEQHPHQSNPSENSLDPNNPLTRTSNPPTTDSNQRTRHFPLLRNRIHSQLQQNNPPQEPNNTTNLNDPNASLPDFILDRPSNNNRSNLLDMIFDWRNNNPQSQGQQSQEINNEMQELERIELGPGGIPLEQVSNPEEMYRSQLMQLESMGFTNKSQNIEVLRMTFGNVEAAIERILNS